MVRPLDRKTILNRKVKVKKIKSLKASLRLQCKDPECLAKELKFLWKIEKLLVFSRQ